MRPAWDEYFMDIVNLIKTRSTCIRRQVGALVVKDKRILSSGYNGAPMGCRHCTEIGCLREKLNIPSGQRHELCRGIHAEQNAIVQAAYSGTSIKDSTLYVTHQPCVLCAKMVINAGIKKIVFHGDYPDELAMELLKEAGVRVVRFDKNGLGLGSSHGHGQSHGLNNEKSHEQNHEQNSEQNSENNHG